MKLLCVIFHVSALTQHHVLDLQRCHLHVLSREALLAHTLQIPVVPCVNCPCVATPAQNIFIDMPLSPM